MKWKFGINSGDKKIYNYYFLFLSLFLCIVQPVFSQDYNYLHYNIKDGLAGSTVYCIYQDKEGFIWFATETGVSRFDGTHFKNFSVKDGLPDNTIIRIYGDSYGRIWMVPFNNSICYYLKGKIHNQENDQVLKKIAIEGIINGVFENRDGTIFISGVTCVYQLWPVETLQQVKTIKFPKFSITKMAVSEPGSFFIYLYHDLYKVYTSDDLNGVYPAKMVKYDRAYPLEGKVETIIIKDDFLCWPESSKKIHIRSKKYNLDYTQTIPGVSVIVSLYNLNDSVLCINTVTKGSFFFNILSRKIENHFLPGKSISHYLIDREGGIWFSSFNEGVYRLNSANFKNLPDKNLSGQISGVYDLLLFRDKIWAASDNGKMQIINNGQLKTISIESIFKNDDQQQVVAIEKRNDILAVASNDYIYISSPKFPIQYIRGFSSVKDICFKNDSVLIVACSNALYSCVLPGFKNRDIISLERITCLLNQNDSVYFGTLDGLCILKPDNSIINLSNSIPLLKNKISAISKDNNGTIWVAVTGAGIVGLQHNKIKFHFNEENGLNSNSVRCLAPDNNLLWAGTENGLNRINLSAAENRIMHFTTSDGLDSDIINTILVKGDTIFTGSPRGITWFDKTKTSDYSLCDLIMLDINVDDKQQPADSLYTLSYGNNNIRFDYVAISYKAAGNIDYYYRLAGLDTAWKSTRQTVLEFISLPPGEYNLQLYARNKFGVESNMYSVRLIVQYPFWQKGWFIFLCIFSVALLTWLIVTARNNVIRKKEVLNRKFEKKLQELEQKALRAQMNPHFIFNCLNSIQEFIIDKDINRANKYLSNFAGLIRQTLENSFQSMITIADEIKYLATYLDLEQLRYRNNFNYFITIDDELKPGELFIPGMLLQPYVENAVRHGLQPKQGSEREIVVSFLKTGNSVTCTIRDNGIGRKAAQAFQTSLHIGYQSRGMQLTKERIDLLNRDLQAPIEVTIKDCTNNKEEIAGTEVILKFPLIYKKIQAV